MPCFPLLLIVLLPIITDCSASIFTLITWLPVEKTTAAMQKNEEDYAKKAAFKSYLTAAKASAVAADADKAFTTTLDKADKKAKDAAAQEAHRVTQVLPVEA